MPISTKTKVGVARANVEMDFAFYDSIREWQSGKCASQVIDGYCTENVSFKWVGHLHIEGELNAYVESGASLEVVVSGSVGKDSTIKCPGGYAVFVGGDFNGTIKSHLTGRIWIVGDLNGTIETGSPHTRIHVGGDFNGMIKPIDRPTLLSLSVDGFASNELLKSVSEACYTQFHACVGISDVEPGIYPRDGGYKKTAGGNSFTRWSIESMATG
jgi:hypothetical protein